MTTPREKPNGQWPTRILSGLAVALLASGVWASIITWSNGRTQEVRIDAQQKKIESFEATMKEFSATQSGMAADHRDNRTIHTQTAENVKRLLDRDRNPSERNDR